MTFQLLTICTVCFVCLCLWYRPMLPKGVTLLGWYWQFWALVEHFVHRQRTTLQESIDYIQRSYHVMVT